MPRFNKFLGKIQIEKNKFIIMRLAISGLGTSVGLGIIKSIRRDKKNHFILGIDNITSAHSFMVDVFEYMPKVEVLESCSQIINLIKSYKIEVVLISSEYEINWFSKNKKIIEFETKCKVLVTSNEWVDIGNDKLKTYQFLYNIGVPLAPFFYFETNKNLWISGINSKILDESDFPIFLKPKKGTSNKGILKFVDISELNIFSFEKSKENFVLQKSLQTNSSDFEVTSSIIVSKSGEVKSDPFHAKRILNKGISWEIERYKSKKLDQLVLLIVKNMSGYLGSLNIQFMGSEENGFFPLEMNTRFSGTTSFRLECGLNEVMYLSYDLLGQTKNYFLDFKSKEKFPKMYRYVEDYIN